MDEDSPLLGVGFAIDFHDSFGQLRSLDDLIGSTQANVVREFRRIEAATKSAVDLGGATAQVKAFGNAATRELASAARETARAEKAGEALVRQLERQNSAFGKTREELRLMKAEAAAVAAEKQGLTELASRIRATESALAGRELAAARRARFEAEELADNRAAEEAAAAQKATEDRIRAERRLVLQLGERQQIEAAIQRNTGLGRVKATDGGATYSALAARAAEDEARAMQEEARAVREAAAAHQLFESKVRAGVAAMREQEAVARQQQAALTQGAAALRASLDPMYAAQQRFNQALDQADDLYRAGAITSREYAAAQKVARDALQQHAAAVMGNGQAFNELSRPMLLASGNARNFALQFSQVGQQVTAGTSVIQALAIQLPDIAAGMNANTQSANKFVSFLGGPWGIATTMAIGLAGSLAYKLWEGRNALEDQIDKLKKDAIETEKAAKAKDRFKASQEGVNQAVREGIEATKQAIEAQRTAAEQDNIAAKAALRTAIELRAKNKARLEETRALLESQRARAGNGATQSDLAAGTMVRLQSQIDRIDKQIDENDEQIIAQQKRVQETRIGLAEEEAMRMTDPMERIRKQYDDQAKAAKDAARAQIAAGKTVTSALTEQLAAIERNRAAAIKAYQATSRVTSTGRDMADFGSPLPGARITSGYGHRERPTAGASSNHLAIDFAARLGQPILAAADGIVKFAEAVKGYGNRIELAHGAGTRTTYSHLSGFNVSDGQAVSKGDVIGYAGKTGTATGVHLHYEVLVNGKKVDPTKGRFPIDAAQVAEEATKARDAMQQFGDRSAESVARLTEQFDEQPRLLDQAARSTRQLDDIIAQLQKRKPPGFEQTIAEAEAAKVAIEQSLVRPFNDLQEASERRGRVAMLSAEGLETQAAVMKTIWEFEDRLGDLTSERADKIRQIVETEATALANAQATAAIRSADNDVLRLSAELELIGQSNEARAIALAQFEAMSVIDQNPDMGVEKQKELVDAYVSRAKAQLTLNTAQAEYNDDLTFAAEQWDIIADSVQSAGRGMAEAFGDAGRAIGDMASIYADFHADRERAEEEHLRKLREVDGSAKLIAKENARFAERTSRVQVQAYGDMASAAKGFFKEGSSGYKALAAAEKVYRVAQLAFSLQSMIQNSAETATTVANAGVRATAEGTAGIAAQSKLPFPFNIAAMAATGAALIAAGVAVFGGGGGGKNTLPQSNTGTGTVLGDGSAQSESVTRAIEALRDVDTVMLGYSRQMAVSLKSIDNQIGGFASLVLRTGDVNASGGVTEGFSANAIGSTLGAIPVIGGILKGLFGTKTKVVGSGLFGEAQTLEDILGSGFDASYYSDIQKKKKFFGITTSTRYSTRYSDADAGLENQFTLILREFNSAILAAAGPLGESTDAIKDKLSGFVVDIGKIDLQGLTGEEIQEKLASVFGAAADKMALAAFPGFERFQKVGEGLFETLVRVSSTVESVTASLGLLGSTAIDLSIDNKVALAGQFDSVGEFTSAIDGYFDAIYSQEEQVAARTAQMGRVFESLGATMPGSIEAFRSLVEAQDLTTAAGQSTYATLLQLAPAFADLQNAMEGARSAADILAERQGLERQRLEVLGDTAGIRALDLAKLDPSNRDYQSETWQIEDDRKAAADLAATRKSEADEARRLAIAIAELEDPARARAMQLEDERAAILDVNLADYDRLQVLKTQAAEIAKQAEVAKAARALEIEIMELSGDTLGAVKARRDDEKAAADASLGPLFDRRNALQDEAAATAKANQIAASRRDLEIEIMELSGNARGALEARRDIERETTAALDESLLARLEYKYALQDQAEAEAKAAEAVQAAEELRAQKLDALAQAYQKQAGDFQATIDKFSGRARELADIRDELTTSILSPAASLALAQSQFDRSAAMARFGDDTALQALGGQAKTYASALLSSASTEVEYRRGMARIMNGLNGGISGAQGMVSEAQQQLDAIEKLYGPLVDSKDAVINLEAAFDDYQSSLSTDVATPMVEAVNAVVGAVDAQTAKVEEQGKKADTTWLELISRLAAVERALRTMQGDGVPVRAKEPLAVTGSVEVSNTVTVEQA